MNADLPEAPLSQQRPAEMVGGLGLDLAHVEDPLLREIGESFAQRGHPPSPKGICLAPR